MSSVNYHWFEASIAVTAIVRITVPAITIPSVIATASSSIAVTARTRGGAAIVRW